MNPPLIRTAELLAIGTELLLGDIVDTNSANLAKRLAEGGVDVYWSQRVGDNRGRIAAALRAALERSDLVVTCGGLGPTDDDLTREAIADVAGEAPAVDPALEAVLRERFARSGRDMPARNLKQAWTIPSATPLPNPVGTAPGWLVALRAGGRDRLIAALPGPPAELLPMWHEQVRPRLAFPEGSFASRTYKTFGAGESHVAEKLARFTNEANPSVATYAKRDGVHVRVAAKGADPAAAAALLATTAGEIEAALSDLTWGTDGDELAERTVAALTRRGARVALVDAATGGAAARLLHEALAGDADDVGPLHGAVIAWRDEALRALAMAGSDPHGAAPTDASERALSLARSARGRFDTDYGVALTAWQAGVGVDKGGRRSSTAAYAVVGPDRSVARTVTFPPEGAGGRDERLTFTALHALWSMTR